jgi:hypothetical protein
MASQEFNSDSWRRLYFLSSSQHPISIDKLNLSDELLDFLKDYNFICIHDIVIFCKYVNADDELETSKEASKKLYRLYNKICSHSRAHLQHELDHALTALSKSCNKDGEIDWDSYIRNKNALISQLAINKINWDQELNVDITSIYKPKKVILPKSSSKRFDLDSIALPFDSVKLIRCNLIIPIQHLQLSANTTDNLKHHKVSTIDQLVRILTKNTRENHLDETTNSEIEKKLLLNLSRPESYNRTFEVLNTLSFLSDSVDEDSKINWKTFWSKRNYCFNHLVAKIDSVAKISLAVSQAPVATLPIEKLLLWLRRRNILTIEEFFNQISCGISSSVSIGKVKLDVFSNTIRFIIENIDEDGFLQLNEIPSAAQRSDKKYSIRILSSQYHFKNSSKLQDSVRSLTLQQIHLGVVGKKLNNIGIKTLADLIDLMQQGIPKTRSLGAVYLSQIYKTITSIDDSVSDSGFIDWNRFCFKMSFVMVPNHQELLSGDEFLNSFTSVIDLLVTKCFDNVESDILKSRLISSHENYKTLAQVSSSYSITRERVRQKEAIVLNNLSSALVYDEYPDLQFRFSKQFSSFWKSAIQQYEDIDSVSAVDFIDGLCQVWNVEKKLLLNNLPLIYSILTKNSLLPKNLKNYLNDLKNPHSVLNSRAKGFITLRGFRSIH